MCTQELKKTPFILQRTIEKSKDSVCIYGNTSMCVYYTQPIMVVVVQMVYWLACSPRVR
jgi:hypothetical protein